MVIDMLELLSERCRTRGTRCERVANTLELVASFPAFPLSSLAPMPSSVRLNQLRELVLDEKTLANSSNLAAVERVPEIKAEDVQEVFFGNVLSAGYVPITSFARNQGAV